VALWDVSTGRGVWGWDLGRGIWDPACGSSGLGGTLQASGHPCSIDSTVRCWDCRSRRPDPIQVLDEAKDGISSVKLSAHEILTGSVDGRVRRYDLRTGQLCSDYIGSPITSVCFSKDGQCVLAASLDSTLRLLDKDTGELLGEYTGHRSTTYRLDCVLNELDTHVGCASEDGHYLLGPVTDGLGVVDLLAQPGDHPGRCPPHALGGDPAQGPRPGGAQGPGTPKSPFQVCRDPQTPP
uniref:WD repeat domain-containing protein 83 n=1 Tax=Serinus canaria TaxID=9135 RepID=A0A8C9MF13_SERCA